MRFYACGSNERLYYRAYERLKIYLEKREKQFSLLYFSRPVNETLRISHYSPLGSAACVSFTVFNHRQ